MSKQAIISNGTTETEKLVQTTDHDVSPHPSWWRPYWELARMHKFPAGSMLVFWPCAFGYILGMRANHPEPLELAYALAGFFAGSTLLHCAACTINDICDRDFDRQVERCKNRPLVAGTVTVFGATVFLIVQTAVFVYALSFVNTNAFICGLFGVAPLHALYPLMKRWTNWPQAWLGLAMNWGLPTAWLIACPDDYRSAPMWALTFGTFCWTIVYDTIYACQDRKDDVAAGVRSTAVLFGTHVKSILAAFAAAFVGALVFAGLETEQGSVYFLISVGGTAAHLVWQLGTLDTDDPKDCWRKFVSNGNLGYIIVGGLLAGWYT